MTNEMLYSISEWVLFAAFLALMIIAAWVGRFVGRRASGSAEEGSRSQVTTVQAAVLGMLALLLGFSFSMALARYDTRKQLVLDEATAIGTTYLRSGLLPKPHADNAARLLRDYVDARIEFYAAGVDKTRLDEAVRRSEELQNQMWAEAEAATTVDVRAVTTGLFIESLNEVIDDHERRVTAMENHVPESVFLLIYFVGAVAMGLTGYAGGLSGYRSLVTTVTTALLIAAITLVIADLDRPRRGLIKVSQGSMMRLKHTMDAEARAVHTSTGAEY